MVGIIWNLRTFLLHGNSQHDSHGDHVTQRNTPTNHLVDHHAETVDIGGKLVTLVIQDFWSRPVDGANVTCQYRVHTCIHVHVYAMYMYNVHMQIHVHTYIYE